MLIVWIVSSLAGLFLLLILLYLLVLIRPRGGLPENRRLLCDYAHRGLHGGGIPENSMAAFERACREGFGIELDVQLSRNGAVMVFHDDTLTRMAGVEKRVCELTLEELKALRLADTEERIPTFAEVLALVGGRVPLLVELKGESFDTSLCPKVVELLGGYEGDFCVESFNPMLIRGMRKRLPHVYYGQLYTNACRDKKKKTLLNRVLTAIALNCFSRPNFIAYNQKDRDSLPVRITTRLYRAPKFVWTVKTEEGVLLAHKKGEYAIFEREFPKGKE